MALPILAELNQELTRLFVAGSRLCADDPRLKKYVEPLARLGEKAPVLLRLSGMLEELLVVEPALSARKLLETESFLLSILATQGETEDKNQTINESVVPAPTSSPTATSVSYRRLAPVLTALSQSGGGRMQVLKAALEEGVFNDPRLAQPVVDALADNSSELTAFLIDDVLPLIGLSVEPYLLKTFNPVGNAADGRRLRALYKLCGERILTLAEECFDNGSVPVKVEAARILAGFPECETLLLGGLTGKKDVREASMYALIRMDSRIGIDKIMELLEKPEVVAVVVNGYSPYLVERILEILASRGAALNAAEKLSDNLRLFAEALEFLRNKKSKTAADYLQSLLTGGLLDNVKNPLPNRGEKITETILQILYETGYGGDFIWDMFMSLQQGLFGKLSGGKKTLPAMLPVYAFHIGAGRLDPETFYDTFFKSQLYQDIIKLDRSAFADVFLKKDHPPFSARIAGYFLNSGDYVMASRTAFSGDAHILNALAGRLQENLDKNKYGYEDDFILERLGRAGHKRFAPLFKLYCERNRGTIAFRESLAKFIN